MKKTELRQKVIPSFLWLLATFMLSTSVGHAQLRSWSSKSGAEMEAELTEVSGDSAVLKTKAGHTVQIRISDLSEPDQSYIAESKNKTSPTTASVSTAPNVIPAKGIQLPVFASGKHRNLFAAYTADRYRASVNRFGVTTLTFLNSDGSPSPNTAKLVARVLTEKAGGAAKPLTLVGWEEDLTPAVIDDTLETVALLEHGVKFTVRTSFGENGIKICGWTDQDKVDGGKLRVDLGLVFNPLDPETNPQEQTLLCMPDKGKDIELTFNKPWDGISRDLEEAKVSGGAWGGAEFSLVPGDLKKAPLRGWIYPGMQLKEGFMLFINKSEADSPSEKEFLNISLNFK